MFSMLGIAFCSLALSAKTVDWEFPREGSCHEGLAFSDGVTGVLVWGGGDTVRLTVGRGDLWDHRGGYEWTTAQSYTNIVDAVRSGDTNRLVSLFCKETPKNEPRNPYMLPFGRVEVKLKDTAMLVRGELDPFTGLGKLILSDGKVIGLAMSKKDHVFAMDLSSVAAFSVEEVHCMEHEVVRRALAPVGFKPATRLHGEVSGGFTWEIPNDKSVSMNWTSENRTLVLSTCRGETGMGRRIPHVTFEEVRASSVVQWTEFWERGARVKVSDPVVQREFDYGMYRFGAMTDPDGVPAGLQGQWLEDDRLVPWNGDYHFNINVQECYAPAYRGGHFAHLKPLFEMVLRWRPILRANAKRFCGIDNGYVMPHSVDDRGVCIGGFWTGTIDHGSAAWTAAMMFKYVRYSGDVDFLRRGGYDFMKGAMNVYWAMMEETPSGALALPLGPSPEWGADDVKEAVGRNPSFQLAAAHRLARDLMAAAELLGEQVDPMWVDVERRLPSYVSDETGINLFEGRRFIESHRHHSHLAGLYPFDTIDLSDPSTKAVVDKSYTTWVEKGTGKWTGWCVPWAAILNVHIGNPIRAIDLLHNWETYYCNQGHGSLHNAIVPGFTAWTVAESFVNSGDGQIMQMDGQCAAAAAVMELMVHEINGRIEFFRGCPAAWNDVSFENIALSDGRRVSGRRVNGNVTIDYTTKK